MPRNRQNIPREERVEEIVAVARELFLERGYAGTTMAEIARAAGVAPAAVYWYFPSKDHAFAAVLDRILAEGADRVDSLAGAGEPPIERLLAALEELEAYRRLRPVVHERLPHAPVIADFHLRFQGWLEEMLLDALGPRLRPEADVELVTESVIAVLEGTLADERSRRPFAEVVRFVIERVSDEPARELAPVRVRRSNGLG